MEDKINEQVYDGLDSTTCSSVPTLKHIIVHSQYIWHPLPNILGYLAPPAKYPRKVGTPPAKYPRKIGTLCLGVPNTRIFGRWVPKSW